MPLNLEQGRADMLNGDEARRRKNLSPKEKELITHLILWQDKTPEEATKLVLQGEVTQKKSKP